jgi:hypothetical protein
MNFSLYDFLTRYEKEWKLDSIKRLVAKATTLSKQLERFVDD